MQVRAQVKAYLVEEVSQLALLDVQRQLANVDPCAHDEGAARACVEERVGKGRDCSAAASNLPQPP